jgi:hypothetical protein
MNVMIGKQEPRNVSNRSLDDSPLELGRPLGNNKKSQCVPEPIKQC